MERSNCFYYKTGACQSGVRCNQLHIVPTISRTILLSKMYERPDMIIPGVDAQGQLIEPRKLQEYFEDFYEDIFEELSVFGEIENLTVCDNFADHMIGNVYVMFKEERQAAAALEVFQRRVYCGRPIIAEFSPVTEFRRAICIEYDEENRCYRGNSCRYIHVKKIGRGMWKKLFGSNSCQSSTRGRIRNLNLPYQYRSQSVGRRDHGNYYAHGHRSADSHGRYDDERGRRQYRTRSPVREGSVERRAKIEQWNREREREREGSVERRAKIEMWNREKEREGSVERRAKIEMWNREREGRR